MINHPLVRQKCAVFSQKDAGGGTQLFSLRRTGRRQIFELRAVGEKRPAGRPSVRKSSRTKTAAGTPNKRKAALHSSQAKAWGNAMAGICRAVLTHAAAKVHASARPRAGRPIPPHHGRNQKNGWTLRSGMMKKDARFSNKKAARPHEDSARTDRLTGKAVSDRS